MTRTCARPVATTIAKRYTRQRPSAELRPNTPAARIATRTPPNTASAERSRTLAWHIAHQPFGVVAGAKQYKHAKLAMFDGYAGTSASGFAAEVAVEEAVALLDYAEELYRDWNDGGRAGGGATARINAEFTGIRRELGDLPGVIANHARLRTMLGHLTKTLHPGPCARVVNDQCGKSGGDASEPHQGTSRRWNTLGGADELPRLRRGLLHEDPRMAGDVLDLLDRAVLRRGTIHQLSVAPRPG
jgi:hypothetical protein